MRAEKKCRYLERVERVRGNQIHKRRKMEGETTGRENTKEGTAPRSKIFGENQMFGSRILTGEMNW